MSRFTTKNYYTQSQFKSPCKHLIKRWFQCHHILYTVYKDLYIVYKIGILLSEYVRFISISAMWAWRLHVAKTLRVVMYHSLFYVDSEGSDQSVWMSMLIYVFVERIDDFVNHVMPWLIYYLISSY